MIWKWLWVANIPENVASVIDNALWDLAGRAFNQPTYKVMGGARDKAKAYASTYPNIGQPRVYAEHALACKNEGYIAYKIHPHYFWNPETQQPTPGRPSNIKADIETIHLVREAVGPDYVLMYDPWGTYMSMEEAIKVGRELEKLDYYWYEHPMPEYRVESYVRLSRELTIPILSPEIVAGGVFSRAEWILRGAGDMSRIDVVRGGITGARKTAIVCEAYGLRCEMHMAGLGQSPGPRRDAGGHFGVLREGTCWRRASITTRRIRISRPPATGSTRTATSTCRRVRAWVTKSTGTTSTAT